MLKTFQAPEGTVTTQFKQVKALLTRTAYSSHSPPPLSTSSSSCHTMLLLPLQVPKLPLHRKGCARDAAKSLRAVSEAKGGTIVREVLSSSERSAFLTREACGLLPYTCFTVLHPLVYLQQLNRPPGKGIFDTNRLSNCDDCRSKLNRNDDRNFYGRGKQWAAFASLLWHRSTIALDCTAVAHSLYCLVFGVQHYLWAFPPCRDTAPGEAC